MSAATETTHGAVVRSWESPGVRLTETSHPAGMVLAGHDHAHPAVTLVLEGSFSECFGRATHDCGRFALLFKPAGASHSNRYGNRGARSFIIELLPSFDVDPFANYQSIAPQAAAATLAPMAFRLYRAFRAEEPSVTADCEELVFRIAAAGRTRLGSIRGRPPRWVQAVEERIRADAVTTPPKLSSLARSCGVHPVYLARVFRRQYGVSIGEYVRRCRIAASLTWLAEPRARCSQVAQAAGYCDQSHFGRAFHRETGSTPSSYRRDVVAARFRSF
jgi:AraC family transcriptional regulator